VVIFKQQLVCISTPAAKATAGQVRGGDERRAALALTWRLSWDWPSPVPSLGSGRAVAVTAVTKHPLICETDVLVPDQRNVTLLHPFLQLPSKTLLPQDTPILTLSGNYCNI